MSDFKFFQEGWNDYLYWQDTDKKIVKKINVLIKDVSRTPFEGLGKPEPLKGKLSGLWSRRIDDFNRFIYFYEDNTIMIVRCRGHYE